MRKKKAYAFSVFVYKSKSSEPPVQEKSPCEYFDMIFDISLHEKTEKLVA